MKVNIGLVSAHQSHLSIKVTCPLQDKITLKTQSPCSLYLAGHEIRGKIVSITNKNHHTNILITSPRNKEQMNALFDIQYSDRQITMMTDNQVDPELYSNTERALAELSRITNREMPDILRELTQFGTHPGKTNLQNVSSRQMIIVLDKARHAIAARAAKT